MGVSIPLFLSLATATAASPVVPPHDSVEAPVGQDLSDVFQDAAAEFAVPEKLLLALAFEASHWRRGAASAWAGVGLFDLREEGEGAGPDGPQVEEVAILLDISPDLLLDSPRQQARGAAALLADRASRSGSTDLPDSSELIDWWDAVRAYSGSHDPAHQDRFARYVFELISFGVPYDVVSGLELRAEPVAVWEIEPPVPPPMPGCDYAGCAQFTAASSSNYSDYSRGGSDIQYVVVHTVQGSYSGCISWFQNSSASVSAHYVVRSSDGEITQMVYEEDVAWHAGNWDYNLASVGIEHEGYVEEPETYYTDAMYAASAALTADVIDRTSASASRSSIIAHSEVPGATHTDPGDGWDWDYYMALIDDALGGGGTITGDLIGVVADSDIYEGDPLVGATVWIEETGESTTTDDDGYYRFYDLALDSYTVTASFDGYADGSCAKEIATGDNWCSIALEPGGGDSGDDGGGDDGGGDDGGGDDTGVAGSGGGGGGGGSGVSGSSPDGTPVRSSELKRGCAVASGQEGVGPVIFGLCLLGLVRRRRQ